ncbi:hypothetical protein Tco_0788107, partial [Tanacetum coccineum]
WCMTRSSTKELLTPFENPKRVLRSRRKLFETPSLAESNSPEFDQISEIEEHIEEEEVIEIRPKIDANAQFELKGQFLKELRDNTFSGSKHEDANKHIKKFLEIEVILFYNGLDIPTRQILNSRGVIPTKTIADAKVAIQEMAEYSQKWHNGTSSKNKSTKTSDELAAIQAQLNRGQCRVARPGFYQRNNGNSSYPARRDTMEESMSKFMAEAKRHEENSNIIKEIRDSTNAAIRNQGASIKTLELQIG